MKAIALLFTLVLSASAATLLPQWKVSDSNLVTHFTAETEKLSSRCLGDVKTADDWKRRAPEMRSELAEMLGLSPMPPHSDLMATVTGRIEQDEFTVEKLHFQSLPHLYVTANLYVPKNLAKPAPAVLYLCGHGPYITNGVSYGTKVSYQHHGVWFAQNGYVCLVVDTLESGEILGQHHGTYREGMWWWNSRGYTPAGVETWNAMRALDYLSTRPEVDTNRLAVTGRSGGGAQSWYITAMDERIRCSAPVAGITDLENHVVDGAVEGHCDCMFFVNTYRWDFPQLAALAAPRPLLFCNTDADNIFPLDGVVRTHAKIRRIYELLGANNDLGLVITPGPHKDTQELQVPVMRWFNHHLRNTNALIETAAAPRFKPMELKVFNELPHDAINTNIHFTFVEAVQAALPRTREDWAEQREKWLTDLRAKVFRTPMERSSSEKLAGDPAIGHYRLILGSPNTALFISMHPNEKAEKLVLDANYPKLGSKREVSELGAVRGWISFSRVDTNLPTDPKKMVSSRAEPVNVAALAKKEVQIRRRHMLLGETADSSRVADIVQAIQGIRGSEQFGNLPIRLEAEGDMAVNALYASLFARVDELILTGMPTTHMQGPDYLNVMRVLDIPQTVAMASERCRLELRSAKSSDWSYATSVAKQFGWQKNLVITEVLSAQR